MEEHQWLIPSPININTQYLGLFQAQELYTNILIPHFKLLNSSPQKEDYLIEILFLKINFLNTINIYLVILKVLRSAPWQLNIYTCCMLFIVMRTVAVGIRL